MTEATRHAMNVTDEATSEGLRLARETGQAHLRMVSYFIDNVADTGQVPATRRAVRGDSER